MSKKLKIENNVKFTGILDQDEWIKLSEEYDVFINTTNADNMPVSIIECLALGLPIVSTNVGGLAYLLENNKNALLVKKNDISQMVEKIMNLINDKNLVKLITKNGRKFSENFSSTVVINKWVKNIK